MKTHKNHLRLLILLLLVLLACAGYMTVGVHFENQKLFAYAMRIRTPKLIAMLITAFAIGSASIVFQSIINNTIVTPCLLGMDQLYSLIHTAVFFVAGSGSFLAVNANAAFAVDLAIMGAVATVIYSYLFRKTNHNVLYVLLIGTVLTSFSVALFYKTYLYPQVYDFFVKGVSGKYGIRLPRFKTCFDLSCLAVAAIMSLAFFGRFEGIGWGTLVIAPINGTVIGLFCRLFDKYFDFPPVFGKFAAHFELDKKQ